MRPTSTTKTRTDSSGLSPAQAARAPLAIWSLEAILAEIQHDDPPDPPLDRERAARRLRSQGFETCPTCKVPVRDELAINRAERRAREVAEGREVHRRAVPS